MVDAERCMSCGTKLRPVSVPIGQASLAEPGRGSGSVEKLVCTRRKCPRYGKPNEETLAGS